MDEIEDDEVEDEVDDDVDEDDMVVWDAVDRFVESVIGGEDTSWWRAKCISSQLPDHMIWILESYDMNTGIIWYEYWNHDNLLLSFLTSFSFPLFGLDDWCRRRRRRRRRRRCCCCCYCYGYRRLTKRSFFASRSRKEVRKFMDFFLAGKWEKWAPWCSVQRPQGGGNFFPIGLNFVEGLFTGMSTYLPVLSSRPWD